MLESNQPKVFTEKFTQAAESFFLEHMPPAKAWKRKAPLGQIHLHICLDLNSNDCYFHLISLIVQLIE